MNHQDKKPGRRVRSPKIERDIFGQEYLEGREVFTLTLDWDAIPEGLQQLIRVQHVGDAAVFDMTSLIRDALREVEPRFWAERLEALTPFEWKLQKALEDPLFRAKVEALF